MKRSLSDLSDIKRSLSDVVMDNNLGHYGGKTAREAHVISQLKTAQLTALEVREKRHKKVQAVLEKGLASGRLIDGCEIVRRLRDLTDKPFPEIKLRPKTVKARKDGFLLPTLKMGLQTLDNGKGYGSFHIAATTTFVGAQPLVQGKK